MQDPVETAMDPLGDQQRQEEEEGQADWRRGWQLEHNEEVVGEHEEVVGDQEEEEVDPEQHPPRRGERCSLGLDLEGRVWLPEAPTDAGREHMTIWHGPSLQGFLVTPWC